MLLNAQLRFCFVLGNKEQREDRDREPVCSKSIITGLTPGPYIVHQALSTASLPSLLTVYKVFPGTTELLVRTRAFSGLYLQDRSTLPVFPCYLLLHPEVTSSGQDHLRAFIGPEQCGLCEWFFQKK